MATSKLQVRFKIEGLTELREVADRIESLGNRGLVNLNSGAIEDALLALRVVSDKVEVPEEVLPDLNEGREWVPKDEEPWAFGSQNKWAVGTEVITAHTLYDQRGYYAHTALRRWSRYAGGVSENSLEG